MTAAEVATVQAGQVDRDAVLRAVGINARDPNAQALLLVCERYGLDPLLKHMVLIQGRPYVTRDGYLAVAHASGQLDGIEVLDQGKSESHWWAKVAVHRKDMSHPFVYVGRYPVDGANRTYRPEMAVKTAEVAALRRAFNVTGAGAADEKWDDPHLAAEPAGDIDTGGYQTRDDWHDALDGIRDDIDAAGPAAVAWVRDQGFDWLWRRDVIETIAARLSSLRDETAAGDTDDGLEEPF